MTGMWGLHPRLPVLCRTAVHLCFTHDREAGLMSPSPPQGVEQGGWPQQESAFVNVTFRYMQTEQIVALLIEERDRISRAIEVLQSGVRRRGRPRKNAFTSAGSIPAAAPTTKKTPRKKRTAAQRQAQADRMKAYWLKRKKTAK